MDKKRVGLIIVVVVIAFLVYNNFRLFNLTQNLLGQVNTLHNNIWNINDEITNLQYAINDIGEQAKAEQSLFSDVSTQETFVDGKINLTVTAIPKQMSNDETMSLVFELAGEKVETPFVGNEVLVELDMVQELSPIIVITSPEGTRQQALETIDFTKLMLAFVYAEVSEQGQGTELQTFFDISVEGAFDISDIKTLEVFAEQQQVPGRDDNGQMVEAPAVELSGNGYHPSGESLDVSFVSDGRYKVEITEFVERDDEFEYKFYAKVTLNDGTTYIPMDEVIGVIGEVLSIQNPEISTYGYVDLIMQLD